MSSSTAPPPSSARHDTAAADAPSAIIYKYLVIDSGPIIKLTGMTTLWNRAEHLYTIPQVLDEIRDAKARQHLQQLPCELHTRTPSSAAVHVISEFAKQTGDYQSLSTTDIHVMALAYDLEREACSGTMDHVRTTPKRVVGLGPLKDLGGGSSKQQQSATTGATATHTSSLEDASEIPCAEDDDDEDSDSDSSSDDEDDSVTEDGGSQANSTAPKMKSWATIVHPKAAAQPQMSSAVIDTQILAPMAKLVISNEDDDDAGQFSDAEDDPLPVSAPIVQAADPDPQSLTTEQELELAFPSLAAAATVPMEHDNDDEESNDDADAAEKEAALLEEQLRLEEERKREALKPISKSGKMYNSFRKYGDLMKPKPVATKPKESPTVTFSDELPKAAPEHDTFADNNSRFVGGLAFAGQDDNVEDDGEGWITSSKEINTMKAAGLLDPMRSGSTKDQASMRQVIGPPPSQRAACATTDFAMQNVLLQMNMELLSVDGMKVRKLKSWVTRCGACYKIFTSTDNLGPMKSKRLFCSHCGSDFLQRIACSVDGKTGRLKLHFSKRYKNNLRGTKFSLPKPSSGNRFQGDLLLREDQLLVGAWNQKVKKLGGGKSRDSAQSIFGKDIAANVGCKASVIGGDDIRVGFGRRNPNAAKGRERRGKKKKTPDKACGLRRY